MQKQMTEQLYSIYEVSKRLNVSTETVESWVRDGHLRCTNVRGVLMISIDALREVSAHAIANRSVVSKSKPLAVSLVQRFPRGIASFARVSMNRFKDALGHLYIDVCERNFEDDLYYFFASPFKRHKKLQQAKSIFRDIFGGLGECSISLGKRYQNLKYHADHYPACDAVVDALGFSDTVKRRTLPARDIHIPPHGDCILIGGPVSSVGTRCAWEYEGPHARALRRRKNAILPLRYYSIADESGQEVRSLPRIAWSIQNIGVKTTANWPIWDAVKQKPLIPKVNRIITSHEERGYLPLDNYIIVTRIKNILAADMIEYAELDKCYWPNLTVIEANHGVGVRAFELILGEEGLRVLESIKREIGEADEFQVVMRVKDLMCTPSGFHRFQTVDSVRIWPMDIEPSTYVKAHEYVMSRLETEIPEIP